LLKTRINQKFRSPLQNPESRVSLNTSRKNFFQGMHENTWRLAKMLPNV